MQNPIIEIKDLSFSYNNGGVQSIGDALRHINLTIGKGQFVGITGATGVGKTTLSYCLNGIIPHTVAGNYDGDVLVKGVSVAELSGQELSRWVGSVFQDPEAQLVSATVEEELAFGPENLAVPRQNIIERIDFALQAVGIGHLRHAAIHSLSGGQKQRVAIAAALAMLPEILVLDEPTSELDPMGTDSVFEVLKKLNVEFGVTIIIIEHKLEHLARYCDRLIVMEGGAVKVDGAPGQIFTRWCDIKALGVQPPQVTEFVARLDEQFNNQLAGRLANPLSDLSAADRLTDRHPGNIPGWNKLISQGEIPVTLEKAGELLRDFLRHELEFLR